MSPVPYQPSFSHDRLRFLPGPISAGHSAATDQNFAIRSQLDFAPGQHFADRSFAQTKRMIDADDRRSFGKPIALDHGVSQPSPELFGDAVERRSAGDECPEFPSELAMHAPENPPATQEILPSAAWKRRRNCFQPPSSSRSRSIFSFSDCNMRGTATSTDTRSRRMVRMTSAGFSAS